MIEKVVLNGEEHKLSPDYKDVRNKPLINGVELKDGNNKIEIIDINIDPDVDIVEEGETPSVINTGTPKSPTLKFSLPKGNTGNTGNAYVPSVDESGNLSFTNTPNDELPSELPSYPIKGPRGIGLTASKTKSGKVTTVSIKTDEIEPTTVEELTIEDGKDAVNPFKGLFALDNNVPDVPSDITMNAVEGDYIYAPNSTNGTTTVVWKFDSTNNDWDETTIDVSDVVSVEFANTSKPVAQTNVVNDLTTGGTTDVLSAEAGKTLADLLAEVVEDDISLTTTADASTEDSACYTGRLIYKSTTPSSAEGTGAGWYENHFNKAVGTANTFADATGGGTSCTCIVINVGGKLNEKVVLEPSETNTVTGQAIFLSEALKRGNSTYAYRKNEIIGEPIELPAGVRKEIAVPEGAKYLYVLRSVKLYESSSSTTVVATKTCYFKTGTTKRIYGKITNVSERISNIETEIEPIRTIEDVISELPELKRKVENHEDWLTKKVTKVQLNEGTSHRGWFGFNGNNWLWYRTGNANNGLITARVFELGENKAIDPGKYDKITIQATNEEVGYIKYRPTVTNAWESVGTAYTFLKELIAFPSSNANASLTTSDFCNGYAPGTTYSERPYKKIAAEGEEEVTIPEDAKYLVVLTVKCNQQGETSSTMKGVSCGTQILLEDVENPTQSFPTFSAEINNRLDNIASELDSDTTIFHFNPVKDVAHKVLQVKNEDGYDIATPSSRTLTRGFTFMQISDCHGGSELTSSKEQWGKVMKYAKALREEELIDDVVDTGDVIQANFTQMFISPRTLEDWRTDEDGETNKILTIVGNHDTQQITSQHWRGFVNKPVYDKLIAPNVNNWNVDQPTGAPENGYCFYKKDYTHNGKTLRCLFLDMMGWGYKRTNATGTRSTDDATAPTFEDDNAQREWVWNQLADARENNMMVAIFCHEVPAEFTAIRSSMSSIYSNKVNANGENLAGYNPKFKELVYLVHYHLMLGGLFAGYICGHSHYSFVGKISGSVTVNNDVRTLVNTAKEGIATSTTVNFDHWGDYYPQKACVVDTEQVGLYRYCDDVVMHDGMRIKNTDSEHSFWLVNITTGGIISLIKIGFHLNKYFQKRDVIRLVGRIYNAFSASSKYLTGSIVRYVDNGVSKYYKMTAQHNANVAWEGSAKEEYQFIFDKNYTNYAQGNIVSKDGNLWKFENPVVVPAHTDWLLSRKEKYVRPSDDETNYPEFDSATIYNADAIISKDGELWKLTVPYVVSTYTDWAASDTVPYSRVISE